MSLEQGAGLGLIELLSTDLRGITPALEITTLASQRGALDPHVLTSPLVVHGYSQELLVLLKDAMQSDYLVSCAVLGGF